MSPRVERPDLRDGWRDAIALLRAFLDSDDTRQGEMLSEILRIYPEATDDLVFPLLAIAAVNARSLEGLDRFIEFAATLAAKSR